jgi:glucosamine 6-phosphate synthetase-like amidotransferase/phosphosugar isomerase protein
MTTKRNGHPYWIYETIMSCGDVLATWNQKRQSEKVQEIADTIVERKPAHIFIAGTGSSHLAALAQTHAFSNTAGIPCSAWVTMELRNYPPPHFDERALLILNTHSGKSPGDVRLIEQAASRGVYTIGVTDMENTPFAQVCDKLLIGRDGSKQEFPSTRTYSSAIYRILLVAAVCAQKLNPGSGAGKLSAILPKLPGMMRTFVEECDLQAKRIVEELVDLSAYFVIASGPNLSTAHEGAMGLTQGSGRPTAGYCIDDYIHGPIQSLSEGQCVVTIAAPGPFQDKFLGLARCARTIGAKILMIAPQASELLEEGDVNIPMPNGIPEVATPVLYCVPFWLLGYHFSLRFGLDPDRLSMDRESFRTSGLAELKKLV